MSLKLARRLGGPEPSTSRFRSGAAEAHIQAWDSIDSTDRHTGRRGSVALELVLLTPLVLVLIVFVAFCGRLTRAEAIVRDAAAAGARAASLRQQPSTARADATAAVLSNLAGHTSTCPAPTMSVDTSSLRPGGQVVGGGALRRPAARPGVARVCPARARSRPAPWRSSTRWRGG